MRHPLQAIFDEHDAPTHAGLETMAAQMAPIVAASSAIEKQMVEYRALIMQAELKGDPELKGKYEFLHTTFAATERDVRAWLAAGRAVVQDLVQLRRVIEQERAGSARNAVSGRPEIADAASTE